MGEGREGLMLAAWRRYPIARARGRPRLSSLRSVTHKVGRVFLAAMVAISSWAVIQAPQAANAAAPFALINGDTVTGGSASVESGIATADGFVVNVVSGAAWHSMTATGFSKYQAVIAGDPTCFAL